MSRAGRDDRSLAGLDELIEKITVDANSDDEKLWAFRQAFEDDSGSTHPTTRAFGSCSTTSGRGGHGKRIEKEGEACEGARPT